MLGEDFFDDFIHKYNKFKGDLNVETDFSKMYPVRFFCDKIYLKYEKPCIIIFDNIDLACVQTQIDVFKATANVSERLNEFMAQESRKDRHCIYFAMRPETYLHSREAKLGKVINFPLPNILEISLGTISKVMLETAEEFDRNEELKCGVEFYSLIDKKNIYVKTFTDVAKYFVNLLDYYLRDLWNSNEFIRKRLGSSEEFHCNIMNYNVRAFYAFWLIQ